LNVAIVHDWLYTYAGSERVLEQMLHVFPDADLFTLFESLPETEREFLQGKQPTTTFLQRMPWITRNHRYYLPLMPMAVEQIDVSRYDIVISSSHAVAKGVLVGPDQLHICMCYSPMRYAWDLQNRYLTRPNLGARAVDLISRMLLHYIRIWDVRASHGVDSFIAISRFVQRRIRKYYRRNSTVIYPPVEVGRYTPSEIRGHFYLTLSRLAPYKRVDLIVETFNKLRSPLIVIGEGEQFKHLQSLAKPNVQLLGFQPDDVVRDYLQRCKAFVFAAEEDFGIAPVEAQAAGAPVIAYGKGGAKETVIDGRTGFFFHEQTVEALSAAIRRFEEEGGNLQTEAIVENAQRFRIERFRDEFRSFVEQEWQRFCGWRDSTAGR